MTESIDLRGNPDFGVRLSATLRRNLSYLTLYSSRTKPLIAPPISQDRLRISAQPSIRAVMAL
ncbi:hypothetical protein MAR_002211 [Mya arenaria]|uniref:Uncharacterized protein n=1 Tax=Mya arenaria TaxID=6604 RepID=A0ABY7FDY9_MYAAR|nr:hypothetical protein MAR_002211 [Mya arenaria]